ncbi:response regulator [Labilibacter sediminis]|nr:response regulator [Labilibacter sediminis]
MGDPKPTVLYVDDEEINLRIFKSTFRRKYIVLTANSAKKGLQILKERKVNLVITDQRMPEMTGVEFLKEIQIRFPHIPPSRLMISGYSDTDAIDEAFKVCQLYRFISKPWNAQELDLIMIEAINHDG